MTTANLKGGFIKTLTVSRDGSSTSYSILKNPFLKKTNNYVCQMTHFITNITPPLNQITEVMFEIKLKGDEDEPVGAEDFDDDWKDPAWTRFTPTPHFSLMGLAQQIEVFFHQFGFRARTLGSNFIEPTSVLHQFVPFIKENLVAVEPDSEEEEEGGDPVLFEDRGWGALADEGRLVKFKLLPDGRFSLDLHSDFSSNFYIRVGPQTQKITGFPEFLFVTEDDGGNTFTSVDGLDQLFTFGFIDQLFTYDAYVGTDFEFQSSYSFNAFDHRLSLDVIATFPLSNRISVVDGKEEHEYILARFPLADYKRFETDLIMTDAGISNETSVTEDVNVGLEDLARGNPDITSVFLLPGNIQQLNMQLWTRYYKEGVISRKETDMARGFWSAKLLFSKKQT